MALFRKRQNSPKKKTTRLQSNEAENFRVRQQALFDSIGEGLIAFNEYGNITDVNQAAIKILGFSSNELIGKWFPKAVQAVDENSKPILPQNRPMVKALETGTPVSTKINYVRKNGAILPVFMTAAPYLINNKPAGGVAVFRDFSHEALVEKAKDEFVSVTSHQLRTPLTSIRLFTELLIDPKTGALNHLQQEYLENIQASTLRMIRLVSDILNISRIELGRLTIEPKEVALQDIIKAQISEMSPLAHKKGIKLSFQQPKKALAAVAIDENLFSQVIHNLLSNAIKYTVVKDTKVEVELGKDAKGYQISVSDNGIGIPQEAQSKLFTRFYRVDNAVAVEGEGTGLGLYLVKQILETSGGKISFVSQLNKGTVFYVTIPLSGMKSKKGDVSLELSKDN